MAIRKIVSYPNPVLSKRTAPVTTIDDNTKTLIQDMIETMYDAPGVGLAANQIGISKRIAVIDVEWVKQDGIKQTHVLINPEIIEKKQDCIEEEGCLSVPGVFEKVTRATEVTVKYLDLDWKENEMRADGLLARAIQHEVDHLDGKLYIDRLSSIKRNLLKKRYRKLSGE